MKVKFDIFYLSNSLCRLNRKLQLRLQSSLRSFKNLGKIESLPLSKAKLSFYKEEMEKFHGKGVNLSIFTYEAFNSKFQDYDRVFYIDADLLFLSSEPEFFDNNFQIGVCPNLALRSWLDYRHKDIPSNYKETELLFNAGLIIVNPKRLTLSSFYADLIDYHKKNMTATYYMFEQGLMGKFLKESSYDVRMFSRVNNVSKRLLTNKYFRENILTAKMVHYVALKPFSTESLLTRPEASYRFVYRFYWSKFEETSAWLFFESCKNKEIYLSCMNQETQGLSSRVKGHVSGLASSHRVPNHGVSSRGVFIRASGLGHGINRSSKGVSLPANLVKIDIKEMNKDGCYFMLRLENSTHCFLLTNLDTLSVKFRELVNRYRPVNYLSSNKQIRSIYPKKFDLININNWDKVIVSLLLSKAKCLLYGKKRFDQNTNLFHWLEKG